MRNPPWVLPFLFPLGLFSYAAANRLWLTLCLWATCISIQWLWRIYGKDQLPWIGWLAAAVFLPLTVGLELGQMGPLILLGIAGFLFCSQRNWPASAGACGLLIALKPHLLFLFWPALVWYAVTEPRWRMFWGFTAAISVSCLLSLGLDGQVFSQYVNLWKQSRAFQDVTPTAGGALRLLIGNHWGIQYLPALAAAAWLAAFRLNRRRHWNWINEMPLLSLVSVVTTPYAWFFDQAVLLPCVLQATGWLATARQRKWLWPAITYCAINGVVLFLILWHRTWFWYTWTPFAWLLLYLWVHRISSRSRVTERSRTPIQPGCTLPRNL
jgi:Glycosyltransferase family 87